MSFQPETEPEPILYSEPEPEPIFYPEPEPEPIFYPEPEPEPSEISTAPHPWQRPMAPIPLDPPLEPPLVTSFLT